MTTDFINQQTQIVLAALNLLLGLAAVAVLASVLIAVWAKIIRKARLWMKDTYYILAWLSWKGWIRVKGCDAKQFLKVAIEADEKRKQEASK
jgi:hypothetical protein